MRTPGREALAVVAAEDFLAYAPRIRDPWPSDPPLQTGELCADCGKTAVTRCARCPADVLTPLCASCTCTCPGECSRLQNACRVHVFPYNRAACGKKICIHRPHPLRLSIYIFFPLLALSYGNMCSRLQNECRVHVFPYNRAACGKKICIHRQHPPRLSIYNIIFPLLALSYGNMCSGPKPF